MIPITEQINPKSDEIDTRSTIEICKIMNSEDALVPAAVNKAIPLIAPLIDEVVTAFKKKGRLVYIGAGTSGRMGVLDASECPPTFGVPDTMVLGVIAGGDRALRNAIERAEDNADSGVEDLKNIDLKPIDVVIGLTASGQAPYVIGALEYAQSIGSKTGSIACNYDAKVFSVSDYGIFVDVGPEIVTGSTRLKSGTAEKLILNMITTTAMIKMGFVYNNYMVNLKPTNSKLELRGKRLIKKIVGCSEDRCEELWNLSGKNIPVAVLIAEFGVSSKKAEQILSQAGNNLHLALNMCKSMNMRDSEI
ncbi:MAG: N-acetylmuramic acid 6-phosphate etherase [Spirochaetales bacterium]